MKKVLLLIVGLAAMGCYAQNDAYLKKLTEDLIVIRKAKSSDAALNKAVLEWSASDSPKITLMDDIQRDKEHEFRGSGANKFKMNQVVTHVYSRQNTGMVSKGDYFNSTEKDIYYSAIEKNVKAMSKVEYTLAGHVGIQEFVFVSFNPGTRFTVTVNGKSAQSEQGIASVVLPRLRETDKILFSISNESGDNESFVILNHNPQK